MKTLLLLAGRSTRFWPLSEKTLFPVCGKTLLEHQIERLEKAGLREVVLVGGDHNLEEASALFPHLQTIQQEDLNLGMQGALFSALPICGSEPVCIVCGNDIIEPEAYRTILDAAAQKNVDGALLAQEVDRYFPGGYLTLQDDKIASIIEKPGEGNEPSNLVNIVAHVHNNAALLLETLQNISSTRDDGYEQALDTLFQSHIYKPVPYTGSWRPVKFPWHLLSLLPALLDEIKYQYVHKTASVHPTAILEGNVYIDEGARILPNAVVVGPCYIGKRSIVGNNVLIRNSSIGDDSVVGYNTEVKSSIFHSHVWTHSTYIGDSVIGHNVSFGAGSVTGNFRLDEQEITSTVKEEKIGTGLSKLGTIIGDHCRLGIHSSTNPGVKIGTGSFISGNLLVTSDVPNTTFVSMKNGEVTYKENRNTPSKPKDREQYKKGI